MRILTALLFALVALFVVVPAGASDRLVPDSAARMRITSRSGFMFAVEITNSSDAPTRFDPIGLYFLPENNEGAEPQRLGVVAGDAVSLAPHQTVTLDLQAYCLDEHRPSPNAAAYRLAPRRMPTVLTNALAGAAKTYPQDIQRAIWRVRAAMPVALLGDTPGAE